MKDGKYDIATAKGMVGQMPVDDATKNGMFQIIDACGGKSKFF